MLTRKYFKNFVKEIINFTVPLRILKQLKKEDMKSLDSQHKANSSLFHYKGALFLFSSDLNVNYPH